MEGMQGGTVVVIQTQRNSECTVDVQKIKSMQSAQKLKFKTLYIFLIRLKKGKIASLHCLLYEEVLKGTEFSVFWQFPAQSNRLTGKEF